ncbi:double-stranded RNA-specific editase Adar isoform X2 [Onthophagus taurus]|uniref:double-stranded RNA-specific editase Adar isoform X2 n=1 Tax=Onthophagus taurus TaxID=166361 RepID=UPI000C2063A6|nr:double-stranded RNA-specific editase Adar isoform X1 [Onthophagus taurus]
MGFGTKVFYRKSGEKVMNLDKVKLETGGVKEEYEPPIINGDNAKQVKKKKLKTSVAITDKNPVATLNELRMGLKYEVLEQSGPPHAPLFTVSVVVDGQQYLGTGRSKRVARCKAAEEALKSFIQFPNSCKIVAPVSANAKVDFTSDAFENNHQQAVNKTETMKQSVPKGAVMLINELYPNIKYECTENNSDLFARFKIIINLEGETFVGTGSSKKMAKSAAATAALTKLLCTKEGDVPIFGNTQFRPSKISSEQQEWADRIGRLVTEKFTSLMVSDPIHIKRKVLAGIVLSRDKELTVISVATGTKCISGARMSLSGAALNDMHAEIISRRCFKVYLFNQLLLLGDEKRRDESIFEPNPGEGGGYRLKDGVDFHLYINTAPCGDARIFSPHEDANAVDRHPNRNSRGQLRTKIESGEGTIPVKSHTSYQAWDAIIQGERLLTMSCSDKIARWNILGVQGALLSHFIEPIYIKTVVLGSLFHESHLYRALCGRVANTLQGLPPPFRLNRPTMCLVTSFETRHPTKAPSFSTNWTIGQDAVEVVNTTSGRTDHGTSRVCKQIFAQKFVELCRSGLTSITGVHNQRFNCYCDAKDSSATYVSAKERLLEGFLKAGLGKWIQKPMEQDQFELHYDDDEPFSVNVDFMDQTLLST